MELSRGVLQPPPRLIPPLLAAQVALADAGSQVGWLFFAFGSIFFWLFAAHADLSAWRFRPDAVATVRGAAFECRNTNYSEGGSRTSGKPVFENRYRYTVDGVQYDGRSYATGVCRAGGSVTVEYLLAQPSYSRIRGMRRGLLSPGVLLVTILPGIGLVFAGAGLWRAPRRIALLRDGLPAAGRVTSSVPTRTRVNGRTVYRITLEFLARDGATHALSVRTNRPERLQNDRQAAILCDPSRPGRALAVDALPGNLSVDETGRILPGASRACLFLPAAALLLNAWFVYRIAMR